MPIDVQTVRAALRSRAHRAVPREGRERDAAVAAILRERAGEAEILFIRRASHQRDPWSGHMAFPGGRQDPADPDLLHTARRETREEVGLSLEHDAELLGRLDDLPAVARGRPAGIIIAPFVFAIRGSPTLRPNRSEVEETLWTEVGPLACGDRDTVYPYELEGRIIQLPGYDVDGRIVWGLTHRMLQTLFETLDVTGRQR